MPSSPFRLGRTSQSLRREAVLFGLAAVYYFAAKLGLRFAFINSSVTTIWPPAGFALAAFVLLGYGVWPAILAGAFFANITTTGAVFPSLGIAVGNTMEGLLAAYLVNRFDAATVVTSLALGGLVSTDDAPRVWLTWWLGDAVSDMVIAPALILWIGVKLGPAWSGSQAAEAVALAVSAALGTLALCGGAFPSRHYPLT